MGPACKESSETVRFPQTRELPAMRYFQQRVRYPIRLPERREATSSMGK